MLKIKAMKRFDPISNLRVSHPEPNQANDLCQILYKTNAAVLKHNSSNKVSTLFQNMKNMFCFSKAVYCVWTCFQIAVTYLPDGKEVPTFLKIFLPFYSHVV